MNNFTKRTISGIAFIVIIVGALMAGPLTFYILFAVITGLCLIETYNLSDATGAKAQKITGIIAGIVIFTLNFLLAGDFIETIWLLIILPFPFLVLTRELYLKESNPFRNIAFTLAGWIYPVLFLSMACWIAYLDVPGSGYNHQMVLGLFVLVWTNDTFAYITGRKLGRHKLFSRISPKKTREGSAGGFLFTILAAMIIFFLFKHLSLLNWIVLAMIVSVAGTFGDLFESAIKRSAGTKESGNLIPGHGGALDRFDSAIFVFPLAYAFLKLAA